MRKIPNKLRAEMANDPFYKRCCYPLPHPCTGKIEFHHAIIWAGRQLNTKASIVPICDFIHAAARIKHIKDKIDLIVLRRMSPEEIRSISKAINYQALKDRLEKLYGTEI